MKTPSKPHQSPRARLRRSTVRFITKPRPAAPAEVSIERRIAWAKATASNYEEWAGREQEPATKAALQVHAARWNRTVETLIAERNARGVQPELPIQP